MCYSKDLRSIQDWLHVTHRIHKNHNLASGALSPCLIPEKWSVLLVGATKLRHGLPFGKFCLGIGCRNFFVQCPHHPRIIWGWPRCNSKDPGLHRMLLRLPWGVSFAPSTTCALSMAKAIQIPIKPLLHPIYHKKQKQLKFQCFWVKRMIAWPLYWS